MSWLRDEKTTQYFDQPGRKRSGCGFVLAGVLGGCLLFFSACGKATKGVPADWWNADWSCRACIRVDSGFYERVDMVVSRKVDFAEWLRKAGVRGAFDGNSPRVMWLRDGKQEEVPARFIPEKESSAKGMLLWQRPGVMSTMVQERFLIYFDALRGAPKPAPKAAALETSQNLVRNGSFEVSDAKDLTRPADWEYTPKTELGKIEWVKGIAHNGQYSMKITNEKGGMTGISASQWINVRAGRRYTLSAWIRCAEGSESGHALATAWFFTADSNAVPAQGGFYGNHKNQAGFKVSPGETPWMRVSGSAINVFDPVLKANIPLPEDRTAPGTGAIRLEISATYGKMRAFFDDIEFKEVAEGEPVKVFVDAVEKN